MTIATFTSIKCFNRFASNFLGRVCLKSKFAANVDEAIEQFEEVVDFQTQFFFISHTPLQLSITVHSLLSSIQRDGLYKSKISGCSLYEICGRGMDGWSKVLNFLWTSLWMRTKQFLKISN